MTSTCPSNLKDYRIPKTERINSFFKDWNAVDWTFYNYCSWRRVSEHNFNKIKDEWHSNLHAIKALGTVPKAIQRYAGRIVKSSQGKTKRPKPSHAAAGSSSIVITNSNISNLTQRNTNNYSSDAHGDDNGNVNGDGSQSDSQDEGPEEVETSMFLVNPALRSLYPYVYELCKDKAVNMSSITPKYVGASIHDRIYKFCRTEMVRYKQMSKIDRSFLHVALSGIVNTMKPYSNMLLNRIPERHTEEVKSIACGYIDIKEDQVNAKVKELKEVLEKSDLKELYRCVLRQKANLIISNDGNDVSDEYKVLEIMEIFIKEVNHGQWRKPKSECDYLFYWKKIFEVIFRGVQNVNLNIGELTSNATKFDRFVNEAEFGDTSKYVSGRKIDMIIGVSTVDLQSNEMVVELSSLELKRSDVDDEYITIQQNKNIRTLKSVLGNLMSITNNIDIVTGMDIVGLSGYIFSVVPFCGAAFATRVQDKVVFLPAVEDDIRNLLSAKSFVLPLLFSFKDHLDKQAQAVDSACRAAMQNRPMQAEVNVNADYILSPTLYSPKR